MRPMVPRWLLLPLVASIGVGVHGQAHGDSPAIEAARAHAQDSSQALLRCHRYLQAWLAQADPESGLIPRNLTESVDLWNGRDAAADNYPYMVLTATFTDRDLVSGRLLDMLKSEQARTNRLGRLGDHYSFSKQGFVHDTIDLDRLVFDNAEYVKDGLIPMTEWMGESPWSQRMTGIMQDLWSHAAVATPYGPIPTLEFEVNGDLLQAGSRLYWFTGDDAYLDQAIRLGDYYLLGDEHPTRDRDELRLIDHGCEVINGLSELYTAVATARPEKRDAYREPLHAIYDRILEVARNEHGLLYSSINPRDGSHSKGVCDTWGYTYDGFYTLYLIDQTEAYRDAVRFVLEHLEDHAATGRPWEGGRADGYADAIEGALNLLNREPIEGAARWIDAEIRKMWAIQRDDGIVEGWHGDGNFARTSLIYSLWKTQGTQVQPWRPDVSIGAAPLGDRGLQIVVAAGEPWSGVIQFDRPRHRDWLHLPLDYPRINQFPEWYTVETDAWYEVQIDEEPPQRLRGERLLSGLPVQLDAAGERVIRVEQSAPDVPPATATGSGK